MTPREKAKELVERFEQHSKSVTYGFNFSGDIDHSVECALICVDEILKEHCHESEHKDPLAQDRWINHWQEVKQEINKL